MKLSALYITLFSLGVFAKAHSASLGLIEFPQKPIAPALGLADLTGKMHKLEDYKGNIVLVHFWATWCPPCRRELKALQEAFEKLRPKGVAVLAINVGEGRAHVRRFLSNRSLTFPVLTDPSAESRLRWQVTAMPTTYVVDQDGVIFFGAIGERNWAKNLLIQQILSIPDAPLKKLAPDWTPVSAK